jgi:signal peptidase I
MSFKFFGTPKPYSLKKSKTILIQIYHQFKRRQKQLSALHKEEIKTTLFNLQQHILSGDREKADTLAKHAEELSKLYLRKTAFTQTRDFVVALAFALAVAVLVRQMWFEFYEIPTGSMRPTLKEQDRLVVSKTDFGINLPLTTKHLYFDNNLVQRNGIFIFTVENMDVEDADTVYFYLFPGKKQYIKRLIGKPGDTLYFYGGKVYGIDRDGKDISPELQVAQLESIDHIPFIHFEGKVVLPEKGAAQTRGIYSSAILYQMNEPIAKLYMAPNHQIVGEMLNLSQIHDANAPSVKDYGDLWGMNNYATARLLTKEQARGLPNQMISDMEEGVLYLELKHHPSLQSLKLNRDPYGRLRPMLGLSTTVIPLKETHLRALFDNLYTARFIVKNGFAFRYGLPASRMAHTLFFPHLPGVPDGCYEFYHGKAYAVKWQGVTQELPSDHPLYQFNPERLQTFFNLGIEFDTNFSPQTNSRQLDTSRYAYFRDGDLYVMGAPIIKKEDPSLAAFVKREESRKSSSPQQLYSPFVDAGAPLTKEGALDIEKIKQFGLKVPDKMYLALGDNYAMSADSRVFGFVPEDNVRGGPSFIFWPPGNRFGAPDQPSYPFVNLPSAIIWSAAAIGFGIWYSIHRKRNSLPLKF